MANDETPADTYDEKLDMFDSDWPSPNIGTDAPAEWDMEEWEEEDDEDYF
jgi:hypothetical protein